MHLNTSGPYFTWSKNAQSNIDSRLDRALCSIEWFDIWHSVSCTALTKHVSDHTPLLLKADNVAVSGPKPFRFISAWSLHPTFEEVVANSWSKPVHASCPMVSIQLKLKQLKYDLKVWNTDVFGNIHVKVKEANDQLQKIQMDIDVSGHSPTLDKLEGEAQANLISALHTQEVFWKEKSRVKWLKDGDRSTAFFHRIARQRWATNKITVLKHQGNSIHDPVLLKEHIVNHFQELYTSQNQTLNHDLVSKVIPQLVSPLDNDLLSSIPNSDEIKRAVFSLNPNSAPGPDGFPGSLYQKCWHIVGEDVCKAITIFFQHSWLLPGFNSNFITLIPKNPSADSISNFRPIALANFIFKVIPKILSDRLSNIAPHLISNQQNGFVKGRHIHNSIGITSECFNMLDRKNFGGNIAIKLDIAKAFDTLDWGFLLKVLTAFGFSTVFINWIKCILNSAMLSILVNGTPCGYFSCSRGVRQGDPLSPILFCLAEEVLSRYISFHADNGSLKPISSPKGIKAPTHSLYADDVILFCRGDKTNLKLVQKILDDYAKASGQFINKSKSKIYFGKEAVHRKPEITTTMGMAAGSTPFNYLGVPIFKGKPKLLHLLPVAEKVRLKLEGWAGKVLSFAGRAELIKSVAVPMLLHSFMVYLWPAKLIQTVNTWLRNFLWSGDIGIKKLVTVAWHSVCRPKLCGGLGMRDLNQLNKAALLKHTWDVLHLDNQWGNHVKGRFNIISTKASTSYKVSSIWPGFKGALQTIDEQAIWIIGDGKQINIWEDRWLPSSPISCPSPLLTKSSKVSSFITTNHWTIPSWFKHQYPFLVSDILQIHLPSKPSVDHLIWPLSPKGELTFKDAYKFYNNSQPVHWVSHLWKPFIPPRVSCLSWKIMQNRVPTQDNLQKRGMFFVSRCEICKTNVDNVEHLFLKCPYAHTLWSWLFSSFLINKDIPNSTSHMWRMIFKVRMSSQLLNLWISGCMLAFHLIWDTRNQAIFDGNRPVISRTLQHLKGWLQDLSSLMPGTMKNSVHELSILHKLGIKGICNSSPKIIEVSWSPPHYHWIKVNTDGMALGSPGLAAIGGVFRSYRGFAKGSFCQFIGIHNAFYAELSAFIKAVEIAWSKNWKSVWFEMDSLTLVNCIHNTSFKPPWQLLTAWNNCLHLLRQMQHHISHIFREGNQPADTLSKLGLHHANLKWWDSHPPKIDAFLAQDYASLPNYRFKQKPKN